MTDTLTAPFSKNGKMDRGTRNLCVAYIGSLVLSAAIGTSLMPSLFNRAADNVVQPVENPITLNIYDGKCYRELGTFEGLGNIEVMCPTDRSELASNSGYTAEQANLN